MRARDRSGCGEWIVEGGASSEGGLSLAFARYCSRPAAFAGDGEAGRCPATEKKLDT